MKKRLDAKGIVQSFGGLASFRSLLSANDMRVPNTKAIEKWFVRQSIPTSWLMEIVELAQRMQRSFDIRQFTVKG